MVCCCIVLAKVAKITNFTKAVDALAFPLFTKSMPLGKKSRLNQRSHSRPRFFACKLFFFSPSVFSDPTGFVDRRSPPWHLRDAPLVATENGSGEMKWYGTGSGSDRVLNL